MVVLIIVGAWIGLNVLIVAWIWALRAHRQRMASARTERPPRAERRILQRRPPAVL